MRAKGGGQTSGEKPYKHIPDTGIRNFIVLINNLAFLLWPGVVCVMNLKSIKGWRRGKVKERQWELPVSQTDSSVFVAV